MEQQVVLFCALWLFTASCCSGHAIYQGTPNILPIGFPRETIVTAAYKVLNRIQVGDAYPAGKSFSDYVQVGTMQINLSFWFLKKANERGYCNAAVDRSVTAFGQELKDGLLPLYLDLMRLVRRQGFDFLILAKDNYMAMYSLDRPKWPQLTDESIEPASFGDCWVFLTGITNAIYKFLRVGLSILSANRAYELIMQTDCNLVLYDLGHSQSLWSSETNGKGDSCYAVVQTDGNFVVYDGKGVALFTTNTYCRLPCYDATSLVVGDDGVLRLFNNWLAIRLWSSDGKPL